MFSHDTCLRLGPHRVCLQEVISGSCCLWTGLEYLSLVSPPANSYTSFKTHLQFPLLWDAFPDLVHRLCE